MASEREAMLALAAHGRALRSRGAHTLAVGRVGRAHRKTFGVVAVFVAPPRGVPRTLDITVGKKRVSVPVSVVIGPRTGVDC